jgi:hypothetical protein
LGSGDNDSRTEGFDIGGGFYSDKWSFDAGLYVSRSAGLGQWNESAELGLDPYLSFSYQPDHLPDLSVSGSASYYQADYISDGGTSMSRSWEVLTELDFAKFWPEVLDSEDEGLKMVFQLTGDTASEEWDGEASRDSNLDYFVGFKVDLTLGE